MNLEEAKEILKQHKMDSRKLDMLNETNRHAIVNNKKVLRDCHLIEEK